MRRNIYGSRIIEYKIWIRDAHLDTIRSSTELESAVTPEKIRYIPDIIIGIEELLISLFQICGSV
jgi:hypothetical protein